MTPPVRPEPAPWLAQWLQAQTADATRTPVQRPTNEYPVLKPANAPMRPGMEAAIRKQSAREPIVQGLEGIQTALENAPSPVGDVASAGAAVREGMKGNYGQAAGYALAALPMVAPLAAKVASKDVDPIVSAFLRDPETGKVFTGATHSEAYEKAIAAGANADDLGLAWAENGAHVGFTTKSGEHIPRSEARRRFGVSESLQADYPVAPKAGTPMAQRSLPDLEAHGRQHGVEGLGTASPEHRVTLSDGTEVNVPGGFEGTFTPYDLFALKAQGINPNLLPEGVHEQIHQKLLRTMSHDSGDDLQLFKGLLFGITSPNSPLTPNEFTVARLMPRSMDDIKKLGEMRGADIPAAFGIDAGKLGGIGTRGSVDYENVANLARMFHKDPKWFRRLPDEGWDEYADRIATQVPGLGTKTASLGAVWDDVATANTSAVDRHMITDAWPELMKDRELMADFRPRVVESWNNPKNDAVPKGAKKVKNLRGILAQPGGQVFARDFMQGLATEPVSGVFRNSKGAFGASVPEKMKGLSWLREPETTNTMNPYYRKILGLQEKVRPKNMSLFGNQWLRWDRMRGRIEPHEVMHPSLHKLPPMELGDIRSALDAHSQAGYKLGRPSVNNPAATGAVLPAVKPVADPRNLMYWGLGGLLGASAGSTAGRGLLADEQ